MTGVSSLEMNGCHYQRCTEQTNEQTKTLSRSANRPSSERADDEDAARGEFESFWRTYPSRGPHPNPKELARREFASAVKRGVDPAVIVRGAKNFAASAGMLGTDQRYIAQAGTWLRQKRWGDYQEVPKPELPRAGMI
jgi:hypothetical protein